MARLPDVLGSLDPAGQKVYERIAAKRGKIRGPYVPLMHHPALAERVGDLGEYLRFDATLPGDLRELAILITARHVSDRKSTRLNSSHSQISYAVFCLKKKKQNNSSHAAS